MTSPTATPSPTASRAPTVNLPGTILPVEPFLAAFAFAELTWNQAGRHHYRTFCRCRDAHGGLTPMVADRMAVQVLGVHPCVVWGEAWWAAAEADLETVAS